MSAAAANAREPHQATLDGIAPAAAPQAPTGAVQLAVLGELVTPALVRDSTHGAGIKLEVLLQQQIEHHPQAASLLAVLHVPDEGSFAATYDAARLLAARLPAGALAMVTGHGIEPGHHLGAAVLRVIHVTSIRPLGAALAGEPPRLHPQDDPAHAH